MTLIHYLRERKQRKIQEAYQDGYGWAWAAWRLEGITLSQISDYILHPYEGAFNAGAMQAIIDIEQLVIHRSPLSDKLVSPQ